jgi:hypothetical protein
MNMPGFNAEASLYEATSSCHSAAEGTRVAGAVYAAQFSLFSDTPQLEAYHAPSFQIVWPLCKWLRCVKFLDPFRGIAIYGPCC